MKKAILSLTVILFVIFSVSGQVSTSNTATTTDKNPSQEKAAPQNENPQANNPNAPNIKFDKMEHDYGTIVQGADGNCEFKFTNEGKEPLILSNVRSSCGCTIPTWPREPILPGQSNVIQVKYDTKRVGIISKTISVMSNAKEPTVTLKIKGNITAAPQEQVPAKDIDNSSSPVNK